MQDNERDRLIEANLPLCRTVALIAMRNVPPGRRHILEDVEACCMLLLVRAAEIFKPELGVPFEIFAKRFMLWKVYDEAGLRRRGLRDNDHFAIDKSTAAIGVPPMQESQAIAKEMAARLAAAVANLPPRAQKVIELQFVEELKNNQVGRCLSMSSEGVRQARNRAVRQLRDLIDVA